MTKDFNVSVSMNQAAPVKTGVVLKQGDFGFDLKITVQDFIVTGTTPQIVFRKAMGAVESTDVTASGNVYTYTFKGTELDTPGKVFCDLKLKNSTTQRISTASFQFEVVADTLDGLTEESSSYSDTIAQIVDGFDDKVDAVKETLNQFDNAYANIINNKDLDFDWIQGGYQSDGSYTDNVVQITTLRIYIPSGMKISASCTNTDAYRQITIREFDANTLARTNLVQITTPGTAVLESTQEGKIYCIGAYKSPSASLDYTDDIKISIDNALYDLFDDQEEKGNKKILSFSDFTAGKMYNVSSGSPSAYIGSNISSILQTNSNSIYSDEPIDVSAYKGQLMMIIADARNVVSTRCYGFCDSEGVITSIYQEKEADWTKTQNNEYMTIIPITDDYFWFSIGTNNGLTKLSVEIAPSFTALYDLIKAETEKERTKLGIPVYVATDGSDDNEGTYASPYATVNKALQVSNYILLGGGTFEQQIDLANCPFADITIRSFNHLNIPVFKPADSVLASSASAVSGYENVKVSTIGSKTFSSSNIWIFQEAIDEVDTLIQDAERHPLQRGYEYRCEDTRIIKTTATTLADALDEIESATQYKWFYDSTEGKLYFSSPDDVSSSHKIRYSTGANLFLNGSREKTLHLAGFTSKYFVFNISETNGSEVVDCCSTNVFGGGAFVYNRVLGGTFIRCEAAHAYSGPNGDGFNGHSTTSGKKFSKQTTVHLIDCWAHDNADDGYSDHERSETEIHGGLYEYNGKAGVTPSYGSHCICYDVLSRNNQNGFYCTGPVTEAEGGKYTQMMCYNCIAENNNSQIGTANYNSGFIVDGAGNSMTLYNCSSIQNAIGYNIRNSNNSGKLIDCKTKNDTTVKAGNGTITIINSDAVV